MSVCMCMQACLAFEGFAVALALQLRACAGHAISFRAGEPVCYAVPGQMPCPGNKSLANHAAAAAVSHASTPSKPPRTRQVT